ncbi:methionyl-tRNA formyltransferase [Spiroplasma endosymbiont of Aspidapion aeneum]|uniref:methionyl-tRNA formyltransferase n=1 Tax=Spiroplasma endosymbiont of Aspidapion aeneum TaxID=3066276 RepID=UPI00313ADCEC
MKSIYKVIFAGTIQISIEILSALLDIKEIDVIALICQPDSIIGRKKELKMCEAKKFALEQNIKVFSPSNIKDIYEDLKALKPDFLITCAYGKIIPQNIIDIFTDCINVHGSLLPKYRGGSPLQAAIRNGDKESGVTLIRMVKAMDAGPIFCQKKFNIDQEENSQTIFEKAGKVGKELVKKHILKIFRKEIIPKEQDDNYVTFAYNLKNEEEHINFKNEAIDVVNFIKSLSPKPTAFCYFGNSRIKIAKADVVNNLFIDKQYLPGQIIDIDKEGIIVACGNNTIIRIRELQREGKKMNSASIYYKNPTIFINYKVFS